MGFICQTWGLKQRAHADSTLFFAIFSGTYRTYVVNPILKPVIYLLQCCHTILFSGELQVLFPRAVFTGCEVRDWRPAHQQALLGTRGG